MHLTQKLLTKFCDELLEKFIIPDESVKNYEASCNDDCKDIILKVITKEDEYNFTINLINNTEDDLKNVNQYLNIVTKGEDACIAIRNVSVTEYDPSDIDVTIAANLESLLRYLAIQHARSIKEGYYKDYINQKTIPICAKDCKEIQDSLCEATKVITVQNVDESLLKEGIEKLISEGTLNLSVNPIYVPNYPLHGRQIFQNTNKLEKCKIINSGDLTAFPLVYDVLLTIFHASTQNLRQHHFHELVDFYYHTLEKELHGIGLDFGVILSPEQFEEEINYYLPHVKLEIAFNTYQKYIKYKNNSGRYTSTKKTCICSSFVRAAISELYECFLYPNLTREDCYKIIENKIGTSNYKFLNWSMTQLEERPGFLGDYFKLNIEIEYDDKVETLNLFAKYLATANEVVRDMSRECFQKEVFFYRTLLPELKSLGLEGILDFLPKCYLSRSNLLIFEDMSIEQYKSLKKNEPLSYENIRLIIKQMAKFHACSILYEEILSERHGEPVRIDDKYNKYLNEVCIKMENLFIGCGVRTTFKYLLDLFPDIPKNMTMETFRSKIHLAYESMFEKVKKSNKYRNVICHGDFWTSNIMFKLNEGNVPVDCCIVDYQLLRYCPPAHDLLFLIYVTTDRKTRTEHMYEIIEEYYSELSKIIGKYNFDLNNIYTRQEFLECCEYLKPAAISIGTLYSQIVLCPNEVIQDLLSDEERANATLFIDRKEMIEKMDNVPPYKQGVRDVLEELYDVCESGVL